MTQAKEVASVLESYPKVIRDDIENEIKRPAINQFNIIKDNFSPSTVDRLVDII